MSDKEQSQDPEVEAEAPEDAEPEVMAENEEGEGDEDVKSYASSNNPGVKINRASRANVDMRCVLQKLDGEAEEKTK